MKTRNAALSLCLAGLFATIACDTELPPDFELPTESGNIYTLAGKGQIHFGHEGDGGPAVHATLGWITGVALDDDGNIYISDGAANTIRKINIANGQITTVAGAFRGYNIIDLTPDAGDGGPATEAHLNIPASLALYGTTLYFTDAANGKVRKVENEIINTAGGSGWSGYEGDGGPATAAKLWAPQGVAVDADGNVYFSDTQNNVVRRIDKGTGTITTVAGTGPEDAGYSGDGGPATAAKLNAPRNLTFDAEGNLYIADSGNHAIRKVSGGIITTIAGTGAEGYTGNGASATSATLSNCHGVAVDSEGNVFIADTGNSVIRKVTGGTITTYAGNGASAYSGDGRPAIMASLSNPMQVAVDATGNLYIADTNNSALRIVIK